MKRDLFALRASLLTDQVREIERKQAQESYLSLIVGNAAGFAVTHGLSDEEIRETFGHQIGTTIANVIDDPDKSFWRSHERATKRLRFIAADGQDNQSMDQRDTIS